MNFAEYQKEALKTRSPFWIDNLKYQDQHLLRLMTAAAAIAGEAGELLNKMKKSIERDKIVIVADAVDEVGDILWYITNFVALLSENSTIALESVAVQNIIKLRKRHGEKFDPTELATRAAYTSDLSLRNIEVASANNNPQGNPNMDGK